MNGRLSIRVMQEDRRRVMTRTVSAGAATLWSIRVTVGPWASVRVTGEGKSQRAKESERARASGRAKRGDGVRFSVSSPSLPPSLPPARPPALPPSLTHSLPLLSLSLPSLARSLDYSLARSLPLSLAPFLSLSLARSLARSIARSLFLMLARSRSLTRSHPHPASLGGGWRACVVRARESVLNLCACELTEPQPPARTQTRPFLSHRAAPRLAVGPPRRAEPRV